MITDQSPSQVVKRSSERSRRWIINEPFTLLLFSSWYLVSYYSPTRWIQVAWRQCSVTTVNILQGEFLIIQIEIRFETLPSHLVVPVNEHQKPSTMMIGSGALVTHQIPNKNSITLAIRFPIAIQRMHALCKCLSLRQLRPNKVFNGAAINPESIFK